MKVSPLSNLSEIHVPYLADACTSMSIQEESEKTNYNCYSPNICELSDFPIMLLHSKNKPSHARGGGGVGVWVGVGGMGGKRSFTFWQDFLFD